jgi:uncharacterized protein YjaG (DUF416 family)
VIILIYGTSKHILNGGRKMTTKQEDMIIRQLIALELKIGKIDKYTSYNNYEIIKACQSNLNHALNSLVKCDE